MPYGPKSGAVLLVPQQEKAARRVRRAAIASLGRLALYDLNSAWSDVVPARDMEKVARGEPSG
jgi:hypothetical protein